MLDVGSLLNMTDYKRYIEWHYKKEKGVEDEVIDVQIKNILEPKSIFNHDSKTVFGLKEVEESAGMIFKALPM